MKILENFRIYLQRRVSFVTPIAMTQQGWEEWHASFREQHPFIYFLTIVIPNAMRRIKHRCMMPYRDARAYIRNRFVHKTHYLDTGLEPGKYHELEDRILHGMMNEFRKFIMEDQKFEHLVWLLNDEEALAEIAYAREEYAILVWWNSRPGRLDPHEYAEVETVKKLMMIPEINSGKLPPLPENMFHYRQALKLSAQIDLEYDTEDEAYMTRLIKIRRSLWT